MEHMSRFFENVWLPLYPPISLKVPSHICINLLQPNTHKISLSNPEMRFLMKNC